MRHPHGPRWLTTETLEKGGRGTAAETRTDRTRWPVAQQSPDWTVSETTQRGSRNYEV